MEKSPLEPTRCRSWTSTLLQNTELYSYQLERSRSFAIIYAPSRCMYGDKALDHAWLHAHLEAHSEGRPSEFTRLAVRKYARTKQGSLSAVMETDSGQRPSPEGIEAPDESLFLRVARLTLDLPKWVHESGRTGGV